MTGKTKESSRPVRLHFTSKGAWKVDMDDLLSRPEVADAFSAGTAIIEREHRHAQINSPPPDGKAANSG